MRSPLPTIGSPPLFERLWKSLTQFRRTSLTGSQRPIARNLGLSTRRDYDLEIKEYPIRDAVVARELIEMTTWCVEARSVLSYLARDVFSSSDGDNQGFSVADTLDDNLTPVNPEIRDIILDLLRRRNGGDYVIGGNFLKKAVRQAVGWGDSFIEISIDREGISPSDYCVSNSIYLPPWEVFRVEDDRGQLLGFEQRRRLQDPDPIQFHPLSVVHFRYEQDYLYGQSIFLQSISDWAKLKDATFDLANAMRAVGCNPTLHILPESADESYRIAYKDNYQNMLMDGMITDLFLLAGSDVRKISNVNPDLKTLIDNVNFLRSRILPPGFPIWLMPGLDTTGAKDISGQPARAYARMRNDICSMVAESVRQIIDIEIVLKKGFDWYVENGKYRLVFPKFLISDSQATQGMPTEDDESNNLGIEDLDSAKKLRYLTNKNGLDISGYNK